jgi:carbamate kinase
MSPLTVVAFGGNAMMEAGEAGTPAQQIAHARAACGPLAELVLRGERLVVVHGNGPQIGQEVRRGLLAQSDVPPLPLDALVAATQGIMGYFLELALRDAFRHVGVEAKVATLATLVVVSRGDPAFDAPDKPIGPVGQRRLVASPRPLEIVDASAVRALVDAGHLVIACGGGGIPVARRAGGELRGVEAVIDKDHAAALLAAELGARELVVLTNVDCVYRHFATPRAEPLPHLSRDVALRMLDEGQFPPGSMGPKIRAACDFLAESNAASESVLISSMRDLPRALRGEVGTRIRRT